MSHVTALPRLWTEAELAGYLGVNPETVARERRRGKLRGRKIGAGIRFTDQDVLEYLDSCATTSKTEAASGTSAGRTEAYHDASALACVIAGKRTLRSPATS
jgi:excisionase family DNA binding protein